MEKHFDTNEFNQEKKYISDYLKSRLDWFDSDSSWKKELSSLIDEINLTSSLSQLEDVLEKFERLNVIKDKEIQEFLTSRSKSELTDLQNSIPNRRVKRPIEQYSQQELKQLADKWRAVSAQNVENDLAQIKKSMWKGVISWIIDRA